MKRFTKLIVGLHIPAIAIICLLISLADFFGLFNLIPANRIPMLTLLLASLILSSLALGHGKSAESQQDAQGLFSKLEPEDIEKVLQKIDPRLRKVLKDGYFIDILEFFQTAANESKVQLNDVARFRFYFIRTLQSHPKSAFLTTVPFLWRDPTIRDAIEQFIQNGGKIEQVLLVKNIQELSSPTIQEMVTQQRDIGVKVHIVNDATTPTDLKKHFIVESKGRIAWETQLDEDGHAGSSIVTTNKHLTASYCRIFEKLRESKIRK